MSGTPAGGKKAAAANKAKDPDFYKKIGSMGGKKGHTGGFASLTPEQHREISAKGGKARRKNFTEKVGDMDFIVYE